MLTLRFAELCRNIRMKEDVGRDPFNQNSNRSDRERRTTSKGGPVFSKLFRLDGTDPLSFGPKFPEILVEWIAPIISEIDVVKIVFTLCGQSDAFVYSYTRVKGHKIF